MSQTHRMNISANCPPLSSGNHNELYVADDCIVRVIELRSPSMVIFKERLLSNMDSMLAMANSTRLRPHCKTHKMEQVIRLWIREGVTKHKAATIASEMLANAGATDVPFALARSGQTSAPSSRWREVSLVPSRSE
ncbi:MAG: hypothetical protein U0936_04445 [Planctomycetaceae bacterium]